MGRYFKKFKLDDAGNRIELDVNSIVGFMQRPEKGPSGITITSVYMAGCDVRFDIAEESTAVVAAIAEAWDAEEPDGD